jgi:hypothetical protein
MIPIPQDSAASAERGEAPDDDDDIVAAARVSVLATCQCAPPQSSELAARPFVLNATCLDPGWCLTVALVLAVRSTRRMYISAVLERIRARRARGFKEAPADAPMESVAQLRVDRCVGARHK